MRTHKKTDMAIPPTTRQYYDEGYDPRLIQRGSWEPCIVCGEKTELFDVVFISPRAETMCSWVCVDKHERKIRKESK